MTDERTYHDSGDYTWDDDDGWPDDSLTPDDYTLLLERRLYEYEQERDDVSRMTVVVYVVFAAASGALGIAAGYALATWTW